MTYLTVETRELEDLRRKHSVATSLLAEHTATLEVQRRLIEAQGKEIAFLRRMLGKTSGKVSLCETAP